MHRFLIKINDQKKRDYFILRQSVTKIENALENISLICSTEKTNDVLDEIKKQIQRLEINWYAE